VEGVGGKVGASRPADGSGLAVDAGLGEALGAASVVEDRASHPVEDMPEGALDHLELVDAHLRLTVRVPRMKT